MPEIVLTVNGLNFAGWKTARVTRSLEAIAGGFELSVSDRWREGQEPWQIFPEDICALTLAGQRVISGYVDRQTPAYSAGEHSLSVAGRDKTAALVDCSALGPPWEYLSTPALTILQRLADPFGVTVVLQPGLTLGKLPEKVTVNPGDSVFSVMETICRKLGVLAVSDGNGGVLIMRPGSTRAMTALVEGENILSGSATFDATGRFARYVVLGQSQGTDDWFGSGTAGVRGEATDTGVLRGSRVLVVRAEGNVTPALATARAKWEAAVRAARGDTVTVSVQGWTQGDGALWPLGALVEVRSPRLGVDGEMLITETVFEVSDGGTTTQLTLRRPDAYLPESARRGGDYQWEEIRRGV
jgi:prophage tail gpP-like protein